MTAIQQGSPDVLVVGAGFSGLYMLYRLREAGFDTVVLEAAPEVGGTWYHNRYPGLRCDVESLEYQYSWNEQLRNEWNWSERYPPQSEILSYVTWVADRLDLRRDITFNTRVTSAHWNESTVRWIVTAADGRVWTPRFVVLGTGALSVPRYPDIPGLDAFKGARAHTADWPESGVALKGKRVGLIGTGSSGVQVAIAAAAEAAHLKVFQRTPAFSVPAHNRKLTDAERDHFRQNFAMYDAMSNATSGAVMYAPAQYSALELDASARDRMLRANWAKGGAFRFGATFKDTRTSEAANKIVADFVRDRIRDVVKDPALAEKLCPQDYFGARRVCVDTGYYEIFNQDNVELVDLRGDGIARFTAAGLQCESGAEHAFDLLILATGYDAMTGAILSLDLRGTGGQTIQTAWAEGPKTYLGLGVAGFPNLFTVTGPGSPSVLSNVIRSIEHHVDWIATCLHDLRQRGARRIEIDDAAQEDWVAHVREVAEGTIFTKAASWYMGANVPGKPRVFMPYAGGLPRYRKTCAEIAADGYRGFSIT